MKKTVKINGEKVKVEIKYAKHELLHHSVTHLKHSEIVDYLEKKVIIINGNEFPILKHFSQGEGSAKILYNYNNVWYNSEKKMIEAILN